MDAQQQPQHRWLSSTEYRERNGGHKGKMQPGSTFWLLVRQGRLPKPHYPFGPTQARWWLPEIEAAERAAMKVEA